MEHPIFSTVALICPKKKQPIYLQPIMHSLLGLLYLQSIYTTLFIKRLLKGKGLVSIGILLGTFSEIESEPLRVSPRGTDRRFI